MKCPYFLGSCSKGVLNNKEICIRCIKAIYNSSDDEAKKILEEQEKKAEGK